MQEINVEYSRLIDEIKTLRGLCARLANALKEIYEKTEHLDIFWDGDANADFIAKINEDLAFINLVQISIKECFVLLDSVIDAYQETEKIIEKIVDEISLGRI